MADEDVQDHDAGSVGGSDKGSGKRTGRKAEHRSRSAYVVLAVGVAALLTLLLIIYFSSDRNQPDQPICTTVSAESARQAVLEGRISRVTLAYDDTVTPPSAQNWGPVLARLDYTDGQCGNLPQGIMNQDDIYLLLGSITVFNDITENTQIVVKYDRETDLSPSLFATPTPPPTPTPEATSTPLPTPSPHASPTAGADMPIGPSLLPASPQASPAATPGD